MNLVGNTKRYKNTQKRQRYKNNRTNTTKFHKFYNQCLVKIKNNEKNKTYSKENYKNIIFKQNIINICEEAIMGQNKKTTTKHTK